MLLPRTPPLYRYTVYVGEKKAADAAFLDVAVRLLLAEHRNLHRDSHIGVQSDLQRVLADLLQRALRHADVGPLDLVALLLQRLDDVVVGDRAEQAAVGASLLRDLDGQPVELRAALLRLGEDVGLGLLQVGAARFERLQVVARRALPCGMRKLRA
jgi:hypothetical protein